MELPAVYLLGALGYGALELLWRGYTHWSMLVLGGICFLLIYLLNTRLRMAVLKKWVLSAAVITTLEYLCGCLVNLYLGWDVWDYSTMRGNLLGQICPQFIFLWFCLSIPCTLLSSGMHRLFCDRQAAK